jgi:hypothetical protein
MLTQDGLPSIHKGGILQFTPIMLLKYAYTDSMHAEGLLTLILSAFICFLT